MALSDSVRRIWKAVPSSAATPSIGSWADHDNVRDQLEPLTELFEAEINLSIWVAAVRLQRERLRPVPSRRPGRVVSREEVWAAVTQMGADGLMFVLAVDQVADAAQAVRFHTPDGVVQSA